MHFCVISISIRESRAGAGLGQLLEVILIDKGGGREGAVYPSCTRVVVPLDLLAARGRVDLSDEQGMISSDGKATFGFN